ncbi:MAG TPA: diaminopimelate epimerase [Polyangiaceae bacterium]|jgi:diaminopimelate epimerase|nr:diaminopimelate epimerase [Polyangiaceae bacterium]
MDLKGARFEKWEGLGNDFVILDVRADHAFGPAEARSLCDRRRGIGADGVLLVERTSGQPPRMIVFNADGSRPEMCGNGLRCVAAHLAAASPEPVREIVIATDAGLRTCLVERASPGVFEVTVGMGTARSTGELTVAVGGREHRFQKVDVGNPHAISFEPFEDADLDRIGPVAATSVPGGTNVELCRVRSTGAPDEFLMEVVVWERGVGRTLACGTGACAALAAACEAGLAPFGTPVRMALPGGELLVTVGSERRDILMKGPARKVFAGEVVSA